MIMCRNNIGNIKTHQCFFRISQPRIRYGTHRNLRMHRVQCGFHILNGIWILSSFSHNNRTVIGFRYIDHLGNRFSMQRTDRRQSFIQQTLCLTCNRRNQ